MAEGSNVGGRYGIWGINPTPISPFEVGLGAAKNIGGIFSQIGENRQRNLENQAKQAQLPYIGREKEALLAETQSKIDEAKARSGVYGAQAQDYMGRLGLERAKAAREQQMTDPTYQFNTLYSAFEKSKEGSPQQLMLANALRNYFPGAVGGGAPATEPQAAVEPQGAVPTAGFSAMPALGGEKVSNMSMIPAVGEGAMTKVPGFGPSRGGGGGVMINPATGERIVTDTPAMETRDLRAITGMQNLPKFVEDAKKNLGKYLSLGQKASLLGNSIKGFALGDTPAGTKAAREASAYAEGDAALKSSAESLLNIFNLNGAAENVATVKSILAPKFGENTTTYGERLNRQLADFVTQQKAAEQRAGYGTVVGQDQPNYSNMPPKLAAVLQRMNPQQQAPAAASQAQQQAPVTQTIGGKTYVQKDGEWYQQ